MVISIGPHKLTREAILGEKISENIFTGGLESVPHFLKSWWSGVPQFALHTSGSTGAPKAITLSRKQMEYSAHTTMQFLDPEHRFRNTFICIPTSFVGGTMALVRALTHDLDVTLIPPSSHPLTNLPLSESWDLVSMVPLQIQSLLDSDPAQLGRFRVILVGGAPLSGKDERRIAALRGVTVFQTYGMTETASHIALRQIGHSAHYQALGDVVLDTDERGCLTAQGTITGHELLTTNDQIHLLNPQQFVWLGRADFVINSGGIKVHPEQVEAALAPQLNVPFLVVGLPDNRLGQQVVLVSEQQPVPLEQLDLSGLPPYQRPRASYVLPQLAYTSNGKIDRLLTLQQLTHAS